MNADERARMLELARATRDKLHGKLASGRYEDEALRQMARLQIETLDEILREANSDSRDKSIKPHDAIRCITIASV
jgi:hypothetical protein